MGALRRTQWALQSDIENIPNRIEVRISPDGSTLINGMGDFNKIMGMV